MTPPSALSYAKESRWLRNFTLQAVQLAVKLHSCGPQGATSQVFWSLVSTGAETAAAHQGLSRWFWDPAAVVSVELGQLMTARCDGRLQLIIRL